MGSGGQEPLAPTLVVYLSSSLVGSAEGTSSLGCDAPQSKGGVGGQPFGTWAALLVPLNWVSPESETCGLGRVPANLSPLLGEATGQLCSLVLSQSTNRCGELSG